MNIFLSILASIFFLIILLLGIGLLKKGRCLGCLGLLIIVLVLPTLICYTYLKINSNWCPSEWDTNNNVEKISDTNVESGEIISISTNKSPYKVEHYYPYTFYFYKDITSKDDIQFSTGCGELNGESICSLFGSLFIREHCFVDKKIKNFVSLSLWDLLDNKYQDKVEIINESSNSSSYRVFDTFETETFWGKKYYKYMCIVETKDFIKWKLISIHEIDSGFVRNYKKDE